MTAETFHADEFAHDAEICAAATPGPWSVQQADDSYSMNALIVTTAQGIGELDDCARNVALILLQEPRYADIDDKLAFERRIHRPSAHSLA